MKMDKIVPRCPRCNKRLGNWLEGNAGYHCKRCRIDIVFEFIGGEVEVNVLRNDRWKWHQGLTIKEEGAIPSVKIN